MCQNWIGINQSGPICATNQKPILYQPIIDVSYAIVDIGLKITVLVTLVNACHHNNCKFCFLHNDRINSKIL